MLSVNFRTPKEHQLELASRFRELRIFRDLKRSTLAVMSGVPEPSIRRFELQGEISLRSLVQLAFALGVESQLDEIFMRPPGATLDEIEQVDKRRSGKTRKRGRK